jgi:hypothetical protein
LCQEIVDELESWSSLPAALQSGGIEKKAAGIINRCLETAAGKELAVLPEYRKADFVFVSKNFGRPRLDVKTVIEVKFNYARQISEIRRRVRSAKGQVNRYREELSPTFTYLLYLIAAPFSNSIPRVNRNSGWRYWNSPLDDAVKALRQVAEIEICSIVADASLAKGAGLHYSLLEFR